MAGGVPSAGHPPGGPSIHGVRFWPLEMHRDARGDLTEAFREEWETGLAPVQWTVLRNVPRSLRGMDVHVVHDDWQVLVDGRAAIGLKDLRRGSPTEEAAEVFDLTSDELRALIVPRGVAHGFYFYEQSTLVVGSTGYYHLEDHIPCHYADPELGIEWPAEPEVLSELDRDAPSLAWLVGQLERWQPL